MPRCPETWTLGVDAVTPTSSGTPRKRPTSPAQSSCPVDARGNDMPDTQHSSLTAGGWLLPGTSALCPPASPHPQFGGPLPLPSTHGCERYPTLRTHRPAPYPSPYAHRDNSPSKSQVPVDGGVGGWETMAGKTSAGAQGAGWEDLSRTHTQAQCLCGSRGTCYVHATEQPRGCRAEWALVICPAVPPPGLWLLLWRPRFACFLNQPDSVIPSLFIPPSTFL